MKKVFSSFLVLMFLISFLSPGFAAQDLSVVINGQSQTYDQPPVLEDGRVLVPMRAVFESLGANIQWDQSTKTVTGTKGSIKVTLKLGSNNANVNGKNVVLDVPADTKNNRTMVPLRFVSEALGSNVNWNGSTRTVTITSNGEIVAEYDVVLNFPADRYPETAAHIKLAISNGESEICTIDRDGADENREESLDGIPTKDGYDRDEWPMAMCAEGGEGASVAYVDPSDNRGAGSWVSNQLEDYSDGTRVLFVIDGNTDAGVDQPEEDTNTDDNYTGPFDPFGEDKNCGDFSTWEDAQAFFEAAGGPDNDPHRLDADGNGIACEGLQ